MSFWTPVENPGTRPWRSWVFDVGCALLAAATSFGTFPSPRPRAPTQAADAIRGVSGTAREALAETRHLLGILRPRAGRNSGSRSPACPTSRACSPGSGRRGCRSACRSALLRGAADSRPGCPQQAGQRTAGADADLVEDVSQVEFNRLDGDVEFGGHFPVRPPGADQPGHG